MTNMIDREVAYQLARRACWSAGAAGFFIGLGTWPLVGWAVSQALRLVA